MRSCSHARKNSSIMALRLSCFQFDTRRLYGCNGHVRIFVEPRKAPAERSWQLSSPPWVTVSISRREMCRLRTCYAGELLGTHPAGPHRLVPAERAKVP